MEKTRLDDLLISGDVFRVEDSGDSDNANIFMYREDRGNLHVVDQVSGEVGEAGEVRSFVVKEIPAYKRLARAQDLGISKTTSYDRILEILRRNVEHVESGLAAGLHLIVEPKYRTHLAFEENLPENSFFSHAYYALQIPKSIHVDVRVPVRKVEELFELGYTQGRTRYERGEMKAREREQSLWLWGKEKLQSAFERLKSKGIVVMGRLEDYAKAYPFTWQTGAWALDRFYETELEATLLQAPEKWKGTGHDMTEAGLDFKTIEEARSFTRGLIGRM